jgi:hypothetical protein
MKAVCRSYGVSSARAALGVSAAVLLSYAPSLEAQAEEQLVIRGAETLGDPVVGVPIDLDLRELPRVPIWIPGDPIREIPRRDSGDGQPIDVAPKLDPLLEAQRRADIGAGVSTIEIQNFAGNSSTANPNDPTGDIGMNYFIEAINGPGGSSVTVYNKTTGALAVGPFSLDRLASSGVCMFGNGDPIVVYDHLADRWFLSEFSISGNALCIYTSRTSDPVAGGWCAYSFVDTSFPDYPKYGVWPDVYTATANQGNSPPVYAFDRVNMLSPDGTNCPTARPTQKTTGPGLPGLGFEAYTPVDLDGRPPPTGAPAYFMRHRDEELNGDPGPSPTTDRLELWALDVDFDTPGKTTFSQLPDVIVSDFDSNLCPPISVFSCVPQPSGPNLDPLLEVIMYRISYRNFGAYETIIGVFQVDVGDFQDHSGERWFELRRTGGGAWSLYQEGTYSPDAEGRFMGMIAMDGLGNTLLAYNVSSTSVFPSIRYTGRAASAALGTMSLPETTLAAGGGSNSTMRYGDYNQMGVDPEDDCTFWFLGMYNPSNKGVRIGAVGFESCLPPFEDGFESGDTSGWSQVFP